MPNAAEVELRKMMTGGLLQGLLHRRNELRHLACAEP
jgi:hypothetical protein